MKTAQLFVEYLDHLGTDLTVSNAARTSFGKESTWEIDGERRLREADAKLIRFLATGFRTNEWDDLLDQVKNTVLHAGDDSSKYLTEILLGYKRSAQHWAPFAHPHIQLRVKMPIFLARQFVKHQIGGTWSEESRRYMSDEPEFWFPKEWHGRPADIKQGSDGVVDLDEMYWRAEDAMFEQGAPFHPESVTKFALETYMEMVRRGVAPEEARIVLPLNTITTVTWTGSLLFWSRVANQRLDSHAQKAANELAKMMDMIIRDLFPVSWPELRGERL